MDNEKKSDDLLLETINDLNAIHEKYSKKNEIEKIYDRLKDYLNQNNINYFKSSKINQEKMKDIIRVKDDRRIKRALIKHYGLGETYIHELIRKSHIRDGYNENNLVYQTCSVNDINSLFKYLHDCFKYLSNSNSLYTKMMTWGLEVLVDDETISREKEKWAGCYLFDGNAFRTKDYDNIFLLKEIFKFMQNINYSDFVGHFLRLGNGDINEECIKIYINFYPDVYEECVLKLFQFLSENNISHESKIADCDRNDSVILRIDGNDYASVAKIINYINNDETGLKYAVGPINPMIPQIGGIGVIPDKGSSYMYDIAKGIFRFLERHKDDQIEDYFSKFKEELSLIFTNKFTRDEILTLISLLNGETNIRDVVIKRTAYDEYTNKQKIQVLLDECNITAKKYNMYWVKSALEYYIKNGDSRHFSNADMRKVFSSIVSSDDAKRIVEAYANEINNGDNNMTLDDQISLFSENLFGNKDIIFFSDICHGTLEKYGKEQLRNAILLYIKENSTKGFSRNISDSKENCRIYISALFPKDIIDLMKRTLKMDKTNIDYDNSTLELLVDKYVDFCVESKYANYDEVPRNIDSKKI